MQVPEISKQNSPLSIAAQCTTFFTLWLMVASNAWAKEAEYPLVENEFFVYSKPIVWVDDHRVLFLGRHSGKKPTKKDGDVNARKFALFIWDMESNQVKHYVDAIGPACFGAGMVRYAIEKIDSDQPGEQPSYVVGRSKWGTEITERMESRRGPNTIINRFTCNVVKRPGKFQKRIVELLLPEHGHLDFGPADDLGSPYDNMATLVRPNGDRIETGMPWSAMENLTFHPWAKGYIGMDQPPVPPKEWSEKRCWPLWTLQPPHKAIRHCVPQGPWVNEPKGSQIFHAELTRVGVFVRYRHQRKETLYKDSGGYVVTKAGAIKVSDGLIQHFAVSPNGCRVAFTYMKDTSTVKEWTPGQRHLRAIDVCKGNAAD